MCPREELNPYLSLRTGLLYPLSYEGNTNSKYHRADKRKVFCGIFTRWYNTYMVKTLLTKAIERVAPAVVSITTAPHSVPPERYALNNQSAPPSNESDLEATGGSGFVVSPDGLILTNKHVVSDELEYFVTLTDERKFEAHIIAKDPTGDLAIIRVEAKNLPTAPLGSAKHLSLGESVIAIGNAYGQFTNTASAGIVSGLSRSLMAQLDDAGNAEELFGLIQTDAAINPGNSGGPLINTEGEVVGINVAMIIGAQNLSFAVPIDIAKKDLDELKRFGRIRKPYLGIKYLPITEAVQKEFDLSSAHGILISSQNKKDPAIAPGGPADAAGLRKGDILLAVNGKKITQQEPFGAHLLRARVGSALILTVLRNNISEDITVRVAEWDSSKEKVL